MQHMKNYEMAEEKIGMPLKKENGENLKCECGGIYRWDGTLHLTHPPQYNFYCEVKNFFIAIVCKKQNIVKAVSTNFGYVFTRLLGSYVSW